MNKRIFYLSLPILVLALGLVISGIPRVHAGPGNFTIQATGPIVFPAGQGASSNVKVNSTGGFSGTINLGATASPAGLTASCAPPSVSITPTSNGTTSCNLSSTTPGTFTLTISGSNGTAGGPGVVTHSVNVAVTVISFTSSLSPSGVTFNSGSSVKAVLTMVPSVFNETVNLSSSSVPPTGLSVQFSLTSLVLNTRSHFTANSTLTFSSSAPNVYNVTITGTPTTAGHPPVSFNAIVNVQGYTLSPSPTSFFREKWGNTFTSTITLTALTGFSGTVTLAAQPAVGFGFAFSPTSVPLSAGGTGSSVLTITLGTPAPGNVTTIATGSSTVSGGTLVNTANIQVQVVGLICIADPSGFTTNCPATPYVFSGPPPTAPQVSPTQIRVGVFAQGSGFMNGADVTLLTNNNILRPYAIDLSGSVLPGANTILECLNGVLVVGTTCASTDIVNATFGTIHASIGAGSGLRTNDNATGLIFTAIYNITGVTPASGVIVGFQTGCTATSIADHKTCVTINNGATKPVPEDFETASLNNQGFNNYPYVAITSSAPSVTVPKGGAASVTLMATAENGWPVASTDSVSFTAIATVGFTAPGIAPAACATVGTSCTVTANFNTGTAGTYSVTVFGTYVATDFNASLLGTGLTNTLVAPVTIQVNVQDALWTINGVPTGVTGQLTQTYQIPKGGPSPAFVYTLQSLGGLTGTVTFSTALGGAGVTFAYPAPFTLPPGGTVTRLVNVTTALAPGSTLQWEPRMAAGTLAAKTGALDRINVNGFSISPASTTVSFSTGGSATDVVTLTSLGGATNGFTGNVTVTGSPTPGTGLIVTCNYPIVPKAGSATSTCRFISATPGTYSVIITAAGGSNNAITNTTAAIGVTVSGDFTIGANPTSVTISSLGGRGDSTITVTSLNSLTGTVNLSSFATLASGLTCSLNPVSVVLGATGTSTLSCVSSNPGKFNVTVTGAFTGPDGLILTHALNVTYTISVSQTTTTTVSCLPNSATVGSSTSCTATVTGASTAASGMVSFSNGAASGSFIPLTCNLGTPTGNSASCSVNYTPTAVGSGSHSITATYQGDTTHSGSVSTPFALTVTKASPTITTTASATSINTGQTASDSASFGAGTAFQPSGPVTYQLFPTVTTGVCSGTPSVVSIVTISNTGAIPNSRAVTFNTTGTFGFEATYPGDANNNAATSSCEPVIVSSAIHATTTAITCTPGSVVVGTSTSCKATVTDTNAAPTNPGGTVTITSNGSGTFTPSNGQCTLTASGANAATCSVSYTPNTVGTGSQSISASYGGDATHSASQSTTPFALTITKASPAITTTPSTSSITVGGTASDSASFTTGTAFQPTGSVSYLVFPTVTSGVCSGTSSTASVVTITGATIPSSRSVIFNSTGTFGFEASYPGDGNNNAATGPCEPVTVNKATPSLTTAISPSSTVTQGTAVTDHGTITGGFPSTGVTGSVSYFFFTGSGCTGTATPEGIVTIGAGNSIPASNSVTASAAGSFSFNATYSGDGNNNRVSSTCEPLTVQNLPVPTLTTSIKNAAGTAVTSVQVGAVIHDSATISGGSGTITGTVAYHFFFNGVCSGASSVSQTVTILNGNAVPDSSPATPTPGSYSYNATYSGDANNAGVTSACEPLTITKAAPSITSTVTPSAVTVGQSATDLASVTGGFSPTGTVTYTAYGNLACTTLVFTSANIPLGTHSAAFTPASAGTFEWIAAYNGDVNNTAVSTACGAEPLTVNKATPSITTSISPSSTVTPGTAVTDHAAITGGFPSSGVTGSVSYFFFTGGTCAGAATSEGIVTIGAANSVPASNSVTPTSAGLFSFNATYSGDGNNNRVSSACELLAIQTLPVPTVNTSIKNTAGAVVTSVVVGSAVHDSATISGGTGTITGTVTYSFFANIGCTSPAASTQAVTIGASNVVPDSSASTPSPAGSFSFQASYAGDANNGPATSACEPLTVNKTSPTLSTLLSSNSITVGNAVSDSATLTSSFQAGGTVVYSVFSNNICTAPGNVVSTVTVTGGVIPNSRLVTFNSTGDFGFQASYSGDANNSVAVSSCEPLTVSTGVSIQTTVSSATITVGGSATDSATLAGQSATASGTVTYTDFTNGVCAAPVKTVSVVTVTNGIVPNSRAVLFNSTGSFSFQAVYSGDPANNAAISPCEPLSVQKANPSITTTPSSSTITVGQSVTDSATLSNFFQAGGSVTYSVFNNGACTPAGTVASVVTVTNGAVSNSRAVMFNATGSYSFQAVYSGDSNNNGANSSCELVTVSPPPVHTTTTAVVCSPSSLQVSTATSCTATVADSSASPTTPTGTISFTTNSTGTFAPAITCALAGTTVGFASCSVSYTPTVTGHHLITGSYGGDSTHSASTGSFNLAVSSAPPPAVHPTKTVVTCSPGSILVNNSTSCTARVIDNSTSPAVPTGIVTFTSNSTGAFNPPSATCTLVAGNAPSMATCSVSYTPTVTGKHLITGSYGGDSSHAQSSGSFTLNVRSRLGGSVLLTFNGFELDDFNNGIGQLDVVVNGQLVADIPAGLNHLTGTGDYKLYENVAVNFGPFDITNLLVNGQNTILFKDPTTFDHFGIVRNVTIVQDGMLLLQVLSARGVYPGFSFSYTFSVPPLMITGFTALAASLVDHNDVTFAVAYTGGTAPFKCVFRFGDGESATVAGSSGGCSATHEYDFAGIFHVAVTVKGASTSDRSPARLTVTILDASPSATISLIQITDVEFD